MPTSKENQAVISNRHYEMNKDKRIAAARVAREAQVNRNKKYVAEYLGSHHCTDCGVEADLEFDHREPSSKRGEVSTLVTKGYSLASVIAEVAKCDVRCRTCHLKRHYG